MGPTSIPIILSASRCHFPKGSEVMISFVLMAFAQTGQMRMLTIMASASGWDRCGTLRLLCQRRGFGSVGSGLQCEGF